MDPWIVVDEAWASMARNGFRSEGPFEPFALRVARNKAIDAYNRAEARRRDRSLQEPIAPGSEESEPRTLADVMPGSAGADADYFARTEHLPLGGSPTASLTWIVASPSVEVACLGTATTPATSTAMIDRNHMPASSSPPVRRRDAASFRLSLPTHRARE